MGAVGIKQVAARAGVALGTVSNVLNRPDKVAAATRQRVLEAMAELGYVRNESARALRSGTSRTVALLVLDASNPFFADVAAGVEAVVGGLDSVMILCDTGGEVERERRYLQQLQELRAQGVIITLATDDCTSIDQLVARGTPVVLVDSGNLEHHSCAVAVDDVAGGRLAVEHLLDTGRRRIAVLGGSDRVRQVRERRAGAAQAAAAAGAGVSLQLLDSSGLDIAAGRQLGRRILDLDPRERPDALFGVNDLVALGAMQVLLDGGQRVPDDVAIIGYDDIEFAAIATCPLSSLRQPGRELGRTAAELLAAELDAPAEHRHRRVVFEPELVIRASTLGAGRPPRRRRRSTAAT